MRRLLPIVLLAVMPAMAASPAFAQQAPSENRGTEDQRMACTPDVFRLCASHIPNVTNIVGCLKQQPQNLSPACRVVFQGERPAYRRNAQPRRPAPQTDASVSSF